MNVLASLREAPWATPERITAYARLALAIYAAAIVAVVATARNGIDVNGHPLGTDFVSFWAAGSLALEGHAVSAYDPVLHAARESSVFGGAAIPYYTWTYPPVFLLVAFALAAFPYGIALTLWLSVTGAAYLATIRKILPRAGTTLVALALPAAIINIGHGQNGFLSAALLGGGLALLESRPWLAGIALGALAYKPQLVLLVPFALVGGRHWRAALAMVATLLALYALTVAAFGSDIWLAARDAISATAKGRVLEQGGVATAKMVTVFAAARLLGADVAIAWAAQWIASIAAAGAVVASWASKRSLDLKAAVLVAAIPLATPFLLDYDLVVLAIPAALLVGEGLAGKFLPWERFAIVAACIMPAFARPLATMAPVPLAAFVEAWFAAIVVRRLARNP